MPEEKQGEVIVNNITWKENNDGMVWQDLADLLNRAFAHPHEPVRKPGYQPLEPEPIAEVRKTRGNSGSYGEDPYEDGHMRTAESVRKVFSNSYGVVYAYDGEKVIACGRVLSDGLEQAAVYNIAVDPDYQGYGLGRCVIARLLSMVQGCETILYTHPQTVRFYETLGWRRMKTGFVIHPGGSFSEFEKSEGFILPEGFRYDPDESDYYETPPEHTGQEE